MRRRIFERQALPSEWVARPLMLNPLDNATSRTNLTCKGILTMINQRSVAGVFPDTTATLDQVNPVVAGSTRNVVSGAQAFLFYSGGLGSAAIFFGRFTRHLSW